MIRLDIVGVRIELTSNDPVLLLKAQDDDRYLPLWIGAAEATAIAMAQQGISPPRPLTHDLLARLITAMGRRLDRVDFTRLDDGVFYAELVLDDGTRIDARPSDSVAVAIRCDAPVWVDPAVLEAAGVAKPVEEHEEVEAFREFLDNVSPEDFEKGFGQS